MLLSAVSSLAQPVIKDPNVVKRNVAGFHAIHVGSAIDLYLSQGNEDAVAVSASESRFVDYIQTDVKDGVLYIYYTNTGRGFSIGNRKLRAYVSVKNLDKLEAVGASDVLISGTLITSSLDLQLSGASDFKGTVDAGSLKVSISGASDMMVRGKANALSVDASGASDFKGYDLVCETCDVKASGASDIRVNCNRESNADASGASDIHIKGNGVIRNMHSSGASSVKKV
ncbi:MAG: DUF2807 domain-containing protein, partial [Bacteroidetes bacterium]|nr:DUF2807 domain-containing protein [Bacteroidota bacterium]